MIIFLGAGASRAFGIPTTKEFISLFDSEVGKNQLYEDVKTVLTGDLLDLESLMTILDDLSKAEPELMRNISPHTSRFLIENLQRNSLVYYKKPDVPENANELMKRLKKIIRRECIMAVRDKRASIIQTYDAFFDSVDRLADSHYSRGEPTRLYPAGLSIFTTNYDTCIETYFSAKHVDFNNGIEHGKWGYNIFNVETYKETLIEIFKLHGSIDLFRKGEDIRQFQSFSADFEPQVTYLGEDYGDEFMVWPIESNGARHAIQSPHFDLYILLRDRLREDIRKNQKSTWVLAGSSFRDLVIVSIMNEALRLIRKTPYPKVILVDLKATLLKEKIEREGFTTLADLIEPIEGQFGASDVFDKLALMKR